MLLLESLDLPQRSVSFLAFSADRLRVRDEFARLAELSAGLGFRDLVLHFATAGGAFSRIEAYVGPEGGDGASVYLGSDLLPAAHAPGAVATLPRLILKGEMRDGYPSYLLELEACTEGRPLLDVGLVLMLATWGPEDSAILELRTALFELGSHFLDHAEEIRLNAAGPCADQIRVRIDFQEEKIVGSLEDDGPSFDPSTSVHVHLKTPSNGVGREPGWFCRLLDHYEHLHEAAGNRIGFQKRVGR